MGRGATSIEGVGNRLPSFFLWPPTLHGIVSFLILIAGPADGWSTRRRKSF